MRIMFDHQIFEMQRYGGVSRYHIELARELNKINNIPVEIPILYSANEYLHDYNGTPVFISNKSGMVKKIEGVRNRFINRKNSINEACVSDIVHVTWTNPYLYRIAKDKLVVTIHDMIHEIYWSDKEEFKREIENKKRAIFESKAIIAISENTKKDILRFYPNIPESKITVVYHGTNHLPLEKAPRVSLPSSYILYVGRRAEYKGTRFMIQALYKYLRLHTELKLLFVGGGAFSDQENHEFKELGIESSVQHLDVTDAELSYIYSHALCFVYPSFYEGFGFPLLEAFDNCCPCICTNSSSLPEVGGTAALYFESDNGNDLVKKIDSIVVDEGLRQKYISRGKERVKLFTWEKCAQETYNVYKQVVDNEAITV